MTKRRVYSGIYTSQPKPSQQDATSASISPASIVKYLGQWEHYSNMANDYLSTLLTLMRDNYLVIGTVLFVVVLSFLLPDITQKLQATHELKDVQKVLSKMSNEIKQAEAACITVADEFCCLHCTMHDDTTETTKDLRDLSVCTSRAMRTTQSEPAQIENRIGYFHRMFNPNRNTSHKEITIMSYVYTDSFDAENKVNPSE